MYTKKEVSHQIFRMLIPMILENILTTSASLVTTAMVGRLLALDISAQGVAMRITNTYLSLYKGLAIGVTITAALYYGKNRRDQSRRTVEQGFVTAVPFGMLLTIAIALFPKAFISIFTTDAEIMARAMGYLRLLTIGLPFVAISCFVTAAFQAQGNTKTPMIIAGLVNIVNIIMGYLFIFGNMGMPALGLTGAAIALVSAQIVGAVFGLVLLYHKRMGLYHGADHGQKFFSLEKIYQKEIYTTGLPAAGENLIWQMAMIIISRVILSYGTDSYAAYQLGMQAESICDMLSIGFVTAANTLAAAAIGRGDDALYKMYFKQLCKICSYLCIFTTVVLLCFPKQLMAVLTDKQNLIEIGSQYIFVMGFTQLQFNLSKIFSGYIRSSGHKYTPMVISFVGIWLFRVVICVLTGWVFHWPLFMVWVAIAIDLTVRAFMSMAVFYKKRVYHYLEDRAAPANTPQTAEE